MIKKFTSILIFSIMTAFIFSCSKTDETNCHVGTPEISADQQKLLLEFIESNRIEAVLHPAGFYYHIDAEGTNKKPNGCSRVEVNYSGKLTNGQEFDRANNVYFELSELINGWRLALPLIKEKGIITIYLPAELGYGEAGVGNMIPKNSITIFTVELLNVRNN